MKAQGGMNPAEQRRFSRFRTYLPIHAICYSPRVPHLRHFRLTLHYEPRLLAVFYLGISSVGASKCQRHEVTRYLLDSHDYGYTVADNCSVMHAREKSKSGRCYELSPSVLVTWKNALPQRSLTTFLGIPLEVLCQGV
jgi:hypothetical protein